MMTFRKMISNGNCLQSFGTLGRSGLQAVDGEVGICEALYFDDVRWAVRYLLVDTGGWLGGRRVLVSPVCIGDVSAKERTIYIELMRFQVENSPPFDPSLPISRQYEAAYFDYYHWPVYWKNEPLLQRAQSSTRAVPLPRAGDTASGIRPPAVRLHASSDILGCSIAVREGAIGSVKEFVVDTRYWVIRYLLTETRARGTNGVLPLSPDWIERINWQDRVMHMDLAAAEMDAAPAVASACGITRDYEARLFAHYGRRGHW